MFNTQRPGCPARSDTLSLPWHNGNKLIVDEVLIGGEKKTMFAYSNRSPEASAVRSTCLSNENGNGVTGLSVLLDGNTTERIQDWPSVLRSTPAKLRLKSARKSYCERCHCEFVVSVGSR